MGEACLGSGAARNQKQKREVEAKKMNVITDAGKDRSAAANRGEIRKRSVVINGHSTSVSVENAFWDALRTLAHRRHASLNQLIAAIDRERTGNLSSAIRVFVLIELQKD
jgi:predicted DNA-binding ribbon-helix-helix protein